MSEKRKKHHRNNSDDEDSVEKARKKAAKKAAKAAKLLGYSNDINPFGDSNLLNPFVWGKKKEKDTIQGKKDKTDETLNQLQTISEIEKVRKRRIERENDLLEMERLRNEEQRLREAAQYGDWQRKEEEFHMEQTRERSKIRLLEDRSKPIDLIARNILLIEAMSSSINDKTRNPDKNSMMLMELDVELRNPIELMDYLDEADLIDLGRDIESYLQLELKNSGPHINFWQSLKEIVTNRIKSSHKQLSKSINSIENDIKQLLFNKDLKELEILEIDIEKNLNNETTNNSLEDLFHQWTRVSIDTSNSEELLIQSNLTNHNNLNDQQNNNTQNQNNNERTFRYLTQRETLIVSLGLSFTNLASGKLH
jgi:hypothetical protein